MRKIKRIIASLTLLFAGFLAFCAAAQPVMAVTCPADSIRGQNGLSAETLAECNVAEKDTLMSTVLGIIRAVLGVLGLVAVVILIVGGVQYMTSTGEAAKAEKAKNTILFAIVGLVIAILAFAIVNFVLTNIL